jgi:anti-anti-sigma factor
MPQEPPFHETSRPADGAKPGFRCDLSDGGRGAACLHVSGALDVDAAPQLSRSMRDATHRARLVVLDLRELTRVDVSGVGAIVAASISARARGRRVILVRGLSQVDRLLALTGATNDVEIVDLASGEPALQALLHIARKDRAQARAHARAPRRVVAFMNPAQIGRGLDALIARGERGEIIDR